MNQKVESAVRCRRRLDVEERKELTETGPREKLSVVWNRATPLRTGQEERGSAFWIWIWMGWVSPLNKSSWWRSCLVHVFLSVWVCCPCLNGMWTIVWIQWTTAVADSAPTWFIWAVSLMYNLYRHWKQIADDEVCTDLSHEEGTNHLEHNCCERWIQTTAARSLLVRRQFSDLCNMLICVTIS